VVPEAKAVGASITTSIAAAATINAIRRNVIILSLLT